ncbi:MAG TPA: ABC transporter ATP-binding protein [Acholeplasmatales bacterium]|nr:MAG: ABC transporter ATP-binding protein [Tenericutes bacterium GWF2_57_13]HAQ56323.1 ABC transporter ATP-binding protein [Acholeplasmatales bacterium]
MHEPVVVVDAITKRFRMSKKQQKIERTDEPIKVAVCGLSFTANQGEIYGLLGPNGAGKTTALRCISTLISPDEGDVRIGGASVKNDAETVRGKIGFLTSDLKLEDFFTPDYLFDYFSRLHGVDLVTAARRKAYFFDKFGIGKFAAVKVGELSTGMRQKVQIAIALVHDPEVIVFDEPTNGLDVLTARVVTDYLKELRDAGKTIIVSTHIFSLVERICDRVGIIIDGRLVLEEKLAAIAGGEIGLEELFFNLVRAESGEIDHA